MPVGDFLHKQTWRTVAALLDADMSILGASESDYDLYAEQVRAEHAGVSEEKWRWGRGHFLRAQLEKPNIFIFGWSKGKFEAAARGNMQRELNNLVGAQQRRERIEV
jgi:predicted metal-dependent HD superfamily phosphohydrolase